MAQRGYDVDLPDFGDKFPERFLAEIEWLQEQKRAALERYARTGSIVGCFWHTPVADSVATYRVESARPLVLAHVPAGDAWHAPDAHIRGLRVQDIKAHLDRELNWQKFRAERSK
jgi:hypothetical protein